MRPTTDEISPEIRAKYSEFPDEGQYLADQRLGQGYDPNEPIIFLTNDLTRQILNKNEQRLNTIKESNESDFCYGTSNLKSNFGEPHECMIALRESIDCLLKSENHTLNYSKTRSNINPRPQTPNHHLSMPKPIDISVSHSANSHSPFQNPRHPTHPPSLPLPNPTQKILDENFDSKTHNHFSYSSDTTPNSPIYDPSEHPKFDQNQSFNKISLIKIGSNDRVRDCNSLDEDREMPGGGLVEGGWGDMDLTGEYG